MEQARAKAEEMLASASSKRRPSAQIFAQPHMRDLDRDTHLDLNSRRQFKTAYGNANGD